MPRKSGGTTGSSSGGPAPSRAPKGKGTGATSGTGKTTEKYTIRTGEGPGREVTTQRTTGVREGMLERDVQTLARGSRQELQAQGERMTQENAGRLLADRYSGVRSAQELLDRTHADAQAMLNKPKSKPQATKSSGKGGSRSEAVRKAWLTRKKNK